MEKQQLFQIIEAYLDGKLGAVEKAAFERRLATDPALARELELHRRLERYFSNKTTVDMRATLDSIAREFPESGLKTDNGTGQTSTNGTVPGAETAGGIPFWWFGLAFFVLVGGGVTFYLLTLEKDTVSAASRLSTELVEEPADSEDAVALGEKEENTGEEESEPAAVAEESKPKASSGAYKTNRELESLIGVEASKRYTFTTGDLGYQVQDGVAYLNFNGKLTTTRSVDEGFFLSLYTNDYPDGGALRVPLKFSEVKADRPIAFAGPKEYVTAYTGVTDLEPALYYGVITLGNSSVPLWVGKVSVK